MDRLKLNGIVAGEVVRQAVADSTIRTLGLVLVRNGQRTAVANQNLTVTANASGNPRVDLVEWSGAALSVLAGTPAPRTTTTPASPSPTAGSIPIATIYVPDSFTTVEAFDRLTDTQALFIAYYYAVGGLFAKKRSTTDVTVSAATNLDNVQLPLFFPSVGTGYRFESYAVLQNVSTTAKSTLRMAHLIDGVGTPNDQGEVTLTARDSALDEFQGISHDSISDLVAESLTIGPHVVVPVVTNAGNNVTVRDYRMSVMQIR